MREELMWAITALLIALITCLINGGVEVETSTRVKVGGKDVFRWLRKRSEGDSSASTNPTGENDDLPDV
jgi:hypothetical protein